MNELILKRKYYYKSCIIGVMYVESVSFYTLENPWRDNRRNISCIPKGVYQAEYLKESASGKYKDIYWIKDVPGRGGILIHNGNVVDHTNGCILIGKRKGYLIDQPAVLNSKTALFEFVEILERQPFSLIII